MDNKMKHFSFSICFLMVLLGLTTFFCGMTGLWGAEPRLAVVVTLGGHDKLFDSLKSMAAPMGYSDHVQELRVSTASVEGLDKTKPMGLLIFCDEKEFHLFGYIPAKSINDLEFYHSDEIKSNILFENGKIFIQRENGKPIQLVETNGWLCFFKEGDEPFIPSGDPMEYFASLSDRYFFGINIFPEAIPADVIDYIAAISRPQMTDTAPYTAVQVEIFKKYFQMLSHSTREILVGCRMDEQGNCISEQSFLAVSGSAMAKTVEKNRSLTTRWSKMMTFPHLVGGVIQAQALSPDEQQYRIDSNNMTFDELITNIEPLFDEESDLEQVKQILINLQKMFAEQFEQGTIDSGLAVMSDQTVAFGISLNNADRMTDMLWTIKRYFAKNDPDFVNEYFQVNSGKMNDYSISRLTVPFDELKAAADSNMMPDFMKMFCSGKDLNLILAVGEEAVVGAMGYDSDKTIERIRELTEMAAKEQPAPARRMMFSLPEFGRFLQNVGLEQSAVTHPIAGILLNALIKADSNAMITVDVEVTKDQYQQTQTITTDSFKVIGEIIRPLVER